MDATQPTDENDAVQHASHARPVTIRLFERAPAPRDSLTDQLAAFYDGGLSFPARTDGRLTVAANFVSTLDGVISYDGQGQQGGGPISGESRADHALMGLLRAHADAVIFGAGSLREDRGHVRTPAFIFPEFAGAYARQRTQLGKREAQPLSVVISKSGELPLDEPTFATPGVHVLVATTDHGAARLTSGSLSPTTEVRAFPSDATGGVDVCALLDVLARDYGVGLALHEGGPASLSSFLRAGVLDELFLTLAPQLAGRSDEHIRPTLIEGLAFEPGSAPWAKLLSVHMSGSHLFLRYQIVAAGTTPETPPGAHS